MFYKSYRSYRSYRSHCSTKATKRETAKGSLPLCFHPTEFLLLLGSNPLKPFEHTEHDTLKKLSINYPYVEQ